MEGTWGRRLPRGAVQMLLVLAVAAMGLFVAAPGAGAQQIGTKASAFGVRVVVYNQMCDNGFQHTRLHVRNLSGGAVLVRVSDPKARMITSRPPGYIPSGTAQVVSIVAAPNAPARIVTASVTPGGPISVNVPFKDCCPQNPGNASCTEVEPTVVPNTTPPRTPSGVVTASKVTTAVESSTLAFTGSDVRFISALAALFVVLGGAFMFVQWRLDSRNILLVGEELTRRGIFGPY